MDKKMVIIIAVVAVVVVAGVVAAVMLIKNDDSYKDSVFEGRLPIFGNANNDDYIDGRDVEYIQDIIDGKKTAKMYTVLDNFTDGKKLERSIADANGDGVINQADIDLVKKLINRESGIRVYYINVDNVLSSAKYPLTTAAVAYKTTYPLMVAAGLSDTVEYVCDMVGNNGDYAQWYPMFKDCKCFGNRATPDYEIFVKEGNTPPSYLITGTKKYYAKTAEESMASLGTDIVRLPVYENGWSVPAALTLGVLTGKESTIRDYVDRADYVYNTIEEHVKNIPMDQRPFVFVNYTGTGVTDYGSGIVETVVRAGGATPIDRGWAKGNVDAETVALTMKPEWIILMPQFGIFETTKGNAKETMDWDAKMFFETDKKYAQAVDHSDAYKQGKVLYYNQGVNFGPASYITTAFIANHIYPDVFHFDVEKLFKEYVNSYFPEVDADAWYQYAFCDLEFVTDYYHNM